MNDIASYIAPGQIEIPMEMDCTGNHWKRHERALRVLARKLKNSAGRGYPFRKVYAVRKAQGDKSIHVFTMHEPFDGARNVIGCGGIVEEVLVEKYNGNLYVRVGRVVCADSTGRVYKVLDNEYTWMIDKTSSAGREFVEEAKKHLSKYDSDDNWVDASGELLTEHE